MEATGISKVLITLDTGAQILFGADNIKSWHIRVSSTPSNDEVYCRLEMEQVRPLRWADWLRRLLPQKGGRGGR